MRYEQIAIGAGAAVAMLVLSMDKCTDDGPCDVPARQPLPKPSAAKLGSLRSKWRANAFIQTYATDPRGTQLRRKQIVEMALREHNDDLAATPVTPVAHIEAIYTTEAAERSPADPKME